MTTKVTPLMQQYFDIKAEYPGTLLLFQVGDFYELFFDDAITAASFLGITLTKRGKNNGEPIPLCGVPVHAIEHYMQKLVKGGFKVALCNQLEEAKPGTVVKRGVTQVLTPGTLTDSALLSEKSSSYLVSLYRTKQEVAFVAAELLTGQLFATRFVGTDTMQLRTELRRFFPDEIVIIDSDKSLAATLKKLGYYVSIVSQFDRDNCEQKAHEWRKKFDKHAQSSIEKYPIITDALSLFHAYLLHTHENALLQFRTIKYYQSNQYLALDAATQRNLELVQNTYDGGTKHTLFSVLDAATTAMGSRMIKKWIVRPLVDKEAIEKRQSVISYLIDNQSILHTLRKLFLCIGDIERVVGRIALSKAPFHDYIALLRALGLVPEIIDTLKQDTQNQGLSYFVSGIQNFSALYSLLCNALNDDTTKDWFIKKRFNQQLDELRDLVMHSNEKILALELQEQQKTGIQSLKIRSNNVHGYYIEVTKPNIHLVPSHYQRTQTLVAKERFVTPELRELQVAIEQAKNQLEFVEKKVFESVKSEVLKCVTDLRRFSYTISYVDALCALSHVANQRGYVRPVMTADGNIIIKNGRHPVIEIALDGNFIPNDTQLTDEQSLWIITGPNMGGKSTYLRQIALISVMAHIGSFVPSQSARISILDRIFTRIGAGDNLAEGKSTFLIEMEETAAICRYATKKSLVILDEVGRGTSTFDGLAIAQAVVEYLYTDVQARCLFATHYHELTQLKQDYPGIVSYYAASKKTDEGIVFLYTMQSGVADGSFGIEVAKLAQLPNKVISRSQSLVDYLLLTSKQTSVGGQSDDQIKQLIDENACLKTEMRDLQLRLKNMQTKLQELNLINFDDLSPKKAFDLLWEMKEKQV